MKEKAIEINSNTNELDLDFIHRSISATYWAKGRSIHEIQTCIDNSLNFGVYLQGKQIGYARVVSDRAVFAYLMDVFIDESQRGKGYSKILVKHILSCNELKNVKTWKLATTNAHALYKTFGFTPLSKPQNMMERNGQDPGTV